MIQRSFAVAMGWLVTALQTKIIYIVPTCNYTNTKPLTFWHTSGLRMRLHTTCIDMHRDGIRDKNLAPLYVLRIQIIS